MRLYRADRGWQSDNGLTYIEPCGVAEHVAATHNQYTTSPTLATEKIEARLRSLGSPSPQKIENTHQLASSGWSPFSMLFNSLSMIGLG